MQPPGPRPLSGTQVDGFKARVQKSAGFSRLGLMESQDLTGVPGLGVKQSFFESPRHPALTARVRLACGWLFHATKSA